jgi:hypothetical protein
MMSFKTSRVFASNLLAPKTNRIRHVSDRRKRVYLFWLLAAGLEMQGLNSLGDQLRQDEEKEKEDNHITSGFLSF